MHQGGAIPAQCNQLPVRWRKGLVFGFTKGGLARCLALEAVALFRLARLLWLFAVLEEIGKIAP